MIYTSYLEAHIDPNINFHVSADYPSSCIKHILHHVDSMKCFKKKSLPYNLPKKPLIVLFFFE